MTCPDGLLLGFGLASPMSSAVCYMRANFGTNEIGQGLYAISTGLLVATDNRVSYVLTAAHALFRSDIPRRAIDVGLWFGCNGPMATATRSSADFDYPAGFETSGNAPSLDFGIVRVAPIDPAILPPVGISSSSAVKTKSVRIVGYPTEDACAGTRQPYHADLTARPQGDNYSYNQLTYDGMSGAPLIGRGASDPGLYSYGVHIRRQDDPSGMQAVRFSAAVIGQIGEWLP